MNIRPPSENQASAGRTILVCDDDRLVLLSVTSSLRKAGFGVVEADNGDDAILLARQHRPDLAVLDIRMDGKSGLDVAAYLRDYVGVPFMFLSAYSGAEQIRQGREFGAVEYLVKPVDPARLVDVVRQAVGLEPDSARTAGRDGVAAIGGLRSVPMHWVAVGVLCSRHRLDLAAALRMLSAEAARRGLALPEAARSIVLEAARTGESAAVSDAPRSGPAG